MPYPNSLQTARHEVDTVSAFHAARASGELQTGRHDRKHSGGELFLRLHCSSSPRFPVPVGCARVLPHAVILLPAFDGPLEVDALPVRMAVLHEPGKAVHDELSEAPNGRTV